jgi:hypothetical protein
VKSGLPSDFGLLDQLADEFVEADVPIEVRGKGCASASVLDALGIVVLEAAFGTSATCVKSIPYMAAVAFPVRFPVGHPFTIRTNYLDSSHPDPEA